MLYRTVAVWCVILVLAVVNGGFRDAILVPRLGETAARAVSSVTLSLLIVATTWVTIRWLGPGSQRDAWTIGVTWVVLTLSFEFLAGHFLMKKPWPELLVDYNVLKGRIWILVLLTTLVAPAFIYRARFPGSAP